MKEEDQLKETSGWLIAMMLLSVIFFTFCIIFVAQIGKQRTTIQSQQETIDSLKNPTKTNEDE